MGFLASLKRRFAHWLLKGSIGERYVSGMLLGGGSRSVFGGWTQDRYQQVVRLSAWNYISIRAIYEEIAGLAPQVGYVRPPEHVKRFGKSARYLTKSQRAKALTSTQPHEEIELVDSGHPLLKLLRNPNGPDTSWTFWARFVMFLELCGISYVWTVPNHLGLPTEMWVLPAHWVRPRSGPADLVEWYDVRPYGGPGVTGTLKYPADEVVQVAYPNPIDYLDGFSPSQAAAEWIDTDDSMRAARWWTFKNGVVAPVIAVELDKEFFDADKQQIARFRAEFREKYQGEAKAGEPIIPPAGSKIVPLSQSAKEMDYIQSGDQLRDWILAVRRVSKTIAGITEDVNYSSMVTSVAAFCQRTIKPKLTLLGQVLTEKLARRYDPDLCVFWPDCTPDDRQQKLAELAAAQQGGGVTPNDWRSFLGQEPYEHGGDDPILPITVAAVPLNTGDDLSDLAALIPVPGKTEPEPEPGLNMDIPGDALPPRGSVPEAEDDPDADLPRPKRLRDRKQASPATPHIRIHLPDLRQGTSFSCGASVTEAVCEYFGVGPETEQEYIQVLGSNPDEGTNVRRIVEFLKQQGLEAAAKEGMTLAELRQQLDAGRPVIVLIQAWGGEGESYASDENGHYVAAVGFDDRGIYFEDPSLKGTRGFLNDAEFLRRWHDEGAGDVGEGARRYVRWGLAVWREERAEPIKAHANGQRRGRDW